MARKHPLDEPPAVSSSDEEEEDLGEEEEDIEEEEDGEPDARKQHNSLESNDEEEEKEGEDEDEEEEEEEEEEEDDDEDEEEKAEPKKSKNNEQPPNPKPTSKNPNHQPPTKPNPKEESDDSETESDPGSVPHSPSVSDFAIKPHFLNKTPAASPKPQKPASVATEKTPVKRSAESVSHKDEKDSKIKAKKAKTSNSNTEHVGGEEGTVASEKKGVINRLWSDEDEVAILKGMIEFQSKKNKDPNHDSTAFHEFMKSYLSVDVSKSQLMDKVRRLKKKYKVNIDKSDEGEDPVISKPHDLKCFQLSKKIWGSSVVATDGKRKSKGSSGKESSAVKSNAKSSKKRPNPDGDSALVGTDPPKEEELSLKKQKQEEATGEEAEFSKLYPFLSELLNMSQSSCSLFPDGVKMIEHNATFVGKTKLSELEEKCRKQKLAEAEVFIGKADLIGDLAQVMVEVIKSRKP